MRLSDVYFSYSQFLHMDIYMKHISSFGHDKQICHISCSSHDLSCFFLLWMLFLWSIENPLEWEKTIIIHWDVLFVELVEIWVIIILDNMPNMDRINFVQQ
ncbi:MAG: hypothetical protein MHMPM18_001421 [Marteilia pararefringens]